LRLEVADSVDSQDRLGPNSYLEASLIQDTANPKLPFVLTYLIASDNMLTSGSRLTRFAGGAAGAIEKATPIVLEIVAAVAGRTKVTYLSSHDTRIILTPE
jgi:hypothetical protein